MQKILLALTLLFISASALAVKHVNVNVKTNKHGMTVEQKNVADRILTDNKAGSIKHLYVISAYSGSVIIYSTVTGKVTSSGKRLQPKTVVSADGQHHRRPFQANKVNINGTQYMSNEIIQDDGTYGNSIPYIFWFDSAGRYHQHYVSGGQIIHVSDQPVAVGEVIINMELSK